MNMITTILHTIGEYTILVPIIAFSGWILYGLLKVFINKFRIFCGKRMNDDEISLMLRLINAKFDAIWLEIHPGAKDPHDYFKNYTDAEYLFKLGTIREKKND